MFTGSLSSLSSSMNCLEGDSSSGGPLLHWVSLPLFEKGSLEKEFICDLCSDSNPSKLWNDASCLPCLISSSVMVSPYLILTL